MTEVSTPIRSGKNPAPLGTCGRPRPGVEARVVDENDCEVAPGEVGELIVRTDRPWAMNHGYYKNPEATARAWRNGWFHTGDAFRVGEDGQYFFVDRMKDAIRRRGENISSFEVETEICAHPADPRSRRRRRAQRVRRGGGAGRGRAGRRRHARSGGADRLPDAAHGPLHGAALHPHRAGAAQDADAEGAEASAAQRRHHRRHLGPREGRHPAQAPAPLGLGRDEGPRSMPATCGATTR